MKRFIALVFVSGVFVTGCSSNGSPVAVPSASLIVSSSASTAKSAHKSSKLIDPMKSKSFPWGAVTEAVDDAQDAWYACVGNLSEDLGTNASFQEPEDAQYAGSDGEWRINMTVTNAFGDVQTWDCHATRVSDGFYRIETK